MSLSKITALGERSQKFHQDLGADLDKAMAGYDDLDAKKADALAKHKGYQDLIHADLTAAAFAVEHLTNLPLDGSALPSQKQSNGVGSVEGRKALPPAPDSEKSDWDIEGTRKHSAAAVLGDPRVGVTLPEWRSMDSAPKDKPIKLKLPGVADDGLAGSWNGSHWMTVRDPVTQVYPSMWMPV